MTDTRDCGGKEGHLNVCKVVRTDNIAAYEQLA